jgi:hypothetical protein
MMATERWFGPPRLERVNRFLESAIAVDVNGNCYVTVPFRRTLFLAIPSFRTIRPMTASGQIRLEWRRAGRGNWVVNNDRGRESLSIRTVNDVTGYFEGGLLR